MEVSRISERENNEIGREVEACHHGNRYALVRVNIRGSQTLHMDGRMEGLSRNRSRRQTPRESRKHVAKEQKECLRKDSAGKKEITWRIEKDSDRVVVLCFVFKDNCRIYQCHLQDLKYMRDYLNYFLLLTQPPPLWGTIETLLI